MISTVGIVVTCLLTSVWARSLGIPTSPFVPSSGEYRLQDTKLIIVDTKYGNVVDERGQTLIPPTLNDFAKTFSEDLKSVQVDVPVECGDKAAPGSIFLTLDNQGKYLDAAGRDTSEGYTLSVSSGGITIAGASPLGVWWGTRTVLQQAIMTNGSIAHGSGIDSPGWGTRGMMLDAGRHYYPPDFLVEMCAYMSYFKQNTFHVHISDNLYNNLKIYSRERSLSLYARFRLWSESEDVAGLNTHKNESYTREQFDHIQSACASRGVTILPEIEAPGHALAFVQWKPELGLSTDLSLLNISNPATIPTMKTIWSTFLPWFHTKTVHIGADEYTADANDYNIFVNAMADHIYATSNKSIRIWGTFPPKYNESGYINIYKNVSVQHWQYFEDNPYYDYILNNYSVLNSDDTFYVVNKWSGSYPQVVNIAKTFNGNPSTGDRMWYPYIFDTKNATNNPTKAEQLVLGEIAPLWNDYGANTSVYSEAYYAWKEGIPALADKQWGGNLTSTEFSSVFEMLNQVTFGQNLERRIHSKSTTILEYSFAESNPNRSGRESSKIPDQSGNGYEGSTDCSITANNSLRIKTSCCLKTPLSSKGREYTLSLTLSVTSLSTPTNATLITGTDSSLLLTPNITFFSGGEYYRLNTSLPINQKVELSIIGRGNQTFAKVDGGPEEEFLTKMGINGERFQWSPMAIEAPLAEVGGYACGWEGELWGMKLTNSA